MIAIFLLLSNALCELYNIKLCMLDDVYVESTTNMGTLPIDIAKSTVSFSSVSGPKNLRYVKSESMKNYIYSYLSSINGLILTPFFTGEDKMLEIIPDDYMSCYRIVRNKDCFSYKIDKKTFTLEKCIENEPTQLFSFNCIDCKLTSQSAYDINEVNELKHKMGRLSVDTYKNLLDVAKMIQNVSKCFTQNQTCNENATELIPVSCFGKLEIANHVDKSNFIYDALRHKFEFDSGRKNKNAYKLMKDELQTTEDGAPHTSFLQMS